MPLTTEQLADRKPRFKKGDLICTKDSQIPCRVICTATLGTNYTAGYAVQRDVEFIAEEDAVRFREKED